MQHRVTSGSSSICASTRLDVGGVHRTAKGAEARHAQGAATAGDGAVSGEASVIECHVSMPKNTSNGAMRSVARFAMLKSGSHTAASLNAKAKKRKNSPA